MKWMKFVGLFIAMIFVLAPVSQMVYGQVEDPIFLQESASKMDLISTVTESISPSALTSFMGLLSPMSFIISPILFFVLGSYHGLKGVALVLFQFTILALEPLWFAHSLPSAILFLITLPLVILIIPIVFFLALRIIPSSFTIDEEGNVDSSNIMGRMVTYITLIIPISQLASIPSQIIHLLFLPITILLWVVAYPAAILVEFLWVPIAILITIVAILFRDQWKQLGKILLLKLFDIAGAIIIRLGPMIFRFLPFFSCMAENQGFVQPTQQVY